MKTIRKGNKISGEFNYSAINNKAARLAEGNVFGLIMMLNLLHQIGQMN